MEIALADPSLATKAFELAIPIIFEFYEKGVNYIDISPSKNLTDLDYCLNIEDFFDIRQRLYKTYKSSHSPSNTP